MTAFNDIKAYFQIILGSLEGNYGGLYEIASLIALVFVFNFVLKWILLKLHAKFEKNQQVWQDSFIRALMQPLSCFIWFFAIIHMIILAAHQSLSLDLSQTLNALLPAGAVLSLTWFLFRWKKYLISNFSQLVDHKKITFDSAKIDVIDKLATLFILFFSLLILLESTEKSLNTLIAFGGVGGLALAIASQEVISNFFGGVMIYITQPFSKGDWIQVPERSIEGIIEEIGWYMTLVRSLDKKPIYVPNSIFSKTVVVNPSRMTHRRFKETVGVRYNDMPVLKELMLDMHKMLEKHPDVDPHNTIIVNLDNFGAYSLDIIVQADLKALDSANFARAKDSILFEIARILAAHNADFATYCPACYGSK